MRGVEPTWLGGVAAGCVALACCGVDVARAAPASVCPPRAGAALTQIELFDGDPADLVILAPDDDREASNTYTVKDLYDAGRHLTVRCHYGAEAVDVVLRAPVAQCRYSGDDQPPALTCR